MRTALFGLLLLLPLGGEARAQGQQYTPQAHQYLTGFNALGRPIAVQPQIADLSDASTITGAWTPYTPTLSCLSGSLTTASASGRYQQIGSGKTILFTVQISITTIGTCAGFVGFTLPVTPKNLGAQFVLGAGRETTTGKMLQAGYLSAVAFAENYDGTCPCSSGFNLSLVGEYESQ